MTKLIATYKKLTCKWEHDDRDVKPVSQPYDIEDGVRIVQQPIIIGSKNPFTKNKLKLSSLIGKLSKQGADEMREQIEALRKEWENALRKEWENREVKY